RFVCAPQRAGRFCRRAVAQRLARQIQPEATKQALQHVLKRCNGKREGCSAVATASQQERQSELRGERDRGWRCRVGSGSASSGGGGGWRRRRSWLRQRRRLRCSRRSRRWTFGYEAGEAWQWQGEQECREGRSFRSRHTGEGLCGGDCSGRGGRACPSRPWPPEEETLGATPAGRDGRGSRRGGRRDRCLAQARGLFPQVGGRMAEACFGCQAGEEGGRGRRQSGRELQGEGEAGSGGRGRG
ncbi:unnamed protein product, partial [Scytosiphon promiscuus]